MSVVFFRRTATKIVRSPRFQVFIAKVAAGNAVPLSTPSAPLLGEQVDTARRISELEAERDALAHELALLRQRLLDEFQNEDQTVMR